jgi:transcription antitermination factor NusG
MNKMARRIPGIRGWLKAPDSLHAKKKKIRIDNMDIFDDFSQVATATKKEVRRFQRMSRENMRFAVQDLVNMNVGDYIVLKGYPYDGLEATVMEVNHTTKMVRLKLYPTMGTMEVDLPFDQVIDSIYSNYDSELRNRTANFEPDMSKITSEAISRVLDIKQY